MTLSVRSLLARAATAAILLVGLAAATEAQLTTANVRGRVTGPDGGAVSGARITATNTETGVARSAESDAQGWYRLIGLQVGSYRVRAQAIGHRPQEKAGLSFHLGDDLSIDFQLTASAVEVQGIDVVAEQTPLVDPGKTSVSTLVDAARISGLPANGRNFSDFIALAPTYASTRLGSGAGFTIGSIGGSRNSGSIMQIDGALNTGTFFGGDARGSDRLPVAISIETVKEFQVLTNEYDVSKGGFVGGLVNAVTKSGTNEFHGTMFEFYRSAALTEASFDSVQPSQFLSHQFGAAVGGPIIRDKAHFFVSVDRNVRRAPFQAASPTTVNTSSANFARLDDIISRVYGVNPGVRDQIITHTNEWAFFGRVDWNLSDRHRLAVRDNITMLDLTGDRIVSADYESNGGPQKPRANSFVANLFSNFTPTLFNEFRFQYATDHKRRPPAVGYSQVRVRLGSSNVAFGADSIIHYNNLEENTLQFADNLTYIRGPHTFGTGFEVNRLDFFNLFFNNGRGTYTFSWGTDQATLDSLERRHASAFTRSVGVTPTGGLDSLGQYIPVADYAAWNYAFFLQDKWQVNPRLFVTAGVRLDMPKVSGTPRNNPQLLDSFPQFFQNAAAIQRLRTGAGTAADSITTGRAVGTRYNFQPRIAATYDLLGDRRTIVRGGVGLFHGYTPFVFWSNIFLNTGRDQFNIACASTTPATQNVTLRDTEVFYDQAPYQCGPAVPPVANAFFFSTRDPLTGAEKPFRTPRTWKMNIGFDHAITNSLAIGGEALWSETRDNYSIRDVNYYSNVVAVLTGEGDRRVVGTAPGTGTGGGSNIRRIDPRFGFVLEHNNQSVGDYLALIGSLRWRNPRLDLSASYTYSRARDDLTNSCCISTSVQSRIEAGVNTNNELGGNFGLSDNNRAHSVIVSAMWRGPAGINMAAIWRTSSGLTFTPRLTSDADANGDGIRGNDRVYVPRNRQDITIDGNGGTAGLGTAAQQDSAYRVLDGFIRDFSCLSTQRGRIVTRNSCNHDGRTVLDLKFSKEVGLPRGHRLELTLDMFNFLGAIDQALADISDRFDGIINWDRKGWGDATFRRENILRIRGFDAANNRYIYEVQGNFGQKITETLFALTQFQVQLGARYRF